MMSQAQTTAPDHQICSLPLYKGFPSRTSSSSSLPHVKENRSTAQPCSTASARAANIANPLVWTKLRAASKFVLIAISPINRQARPNEPRILPPGVTSAKTPGVRAKVTLWAPLLLCYRWKVDRDNLPSAVHTRSFGSQVQSRPLTDLSWPFSSTEENAVLLTSQHGN